MARELINEINLPDYTTTVTLEGESFELRWRFNDRISSWFLDVFDDAGDVLVYGRRIVADWEIFSQNFHTEGMPAGSLIPFDTTLAKTDPKLGELGDRVLMIYLTSDDLAEVAGT